MKLDRAKNTEKKKKRKYLPQVSWSVQPWLGSRCFQVWGWMVTELYSRLMSLLYQTQIKCFKTFKHSFLHRSNVLKLSNVQTFISSHPNVSYVSKKFFYKVVQLYRVIAEMLLENLNMRSFGHKTQSFRHNLNWASN